MWPSVTATCPTFGRFGRLQDSIACFLLQDYPGEKCLRICNDAHIPLQLTASNGEEVVVGDKTKILLTNVAKRFPNVGLKREAIADLVTTDLIAHWDDDDLYFPWHFSTLIGILRARPEIDCVKPVRAFWATGPPDKIKTGHLYGGVYDPQMIYRRGTAVRVPDQVHSAILVMLGDYWDKGTLDRCKELPVTDYSYAYRTHDGIRHMCKIGTRRSGEFLRAFARKNKDHREGESLLPDSELVEWARNRMRNQFTRFANGLKNVINAEPAKILKQRFMEVLSGPS